MISILAFIPKKKRSAISATCDDTRMSTTRKPAALAALRKEVAGFGLEIFRELLKNLLQLSVPVCLVAGIDRNREFDHHTHRLLP